MMQIDWSTPRPPPALLAVEDPQPSASMATPDRPLLLFIAAGLCTVFRILTQLGAHVKDCPPGWSPVEMFFSRWNEPGAASPGCPAHPAPRIHQELKDSLGDLQQQGEDQSGNDQAHGLEPPGPGRDLDHCLLLDRQAGHGIVEVLHALEISAVHSPAAASSRWDADARPSGTVFGSSSLASTITLSVFIELRENTLIHSLVKSPLSRRSR